MYCIRLRTEPRWQLVRKFYKFNEYKVLDGFGKVPRGAADEKAEREYAVFNRTQPVFSDFDAEIKRIEEGHQLS